MYLKELEIMGFKSFSDKTNINFTKGINAIVGPNGSGKSNITDAIRWVIGEQSVKALRGNKMEDVIFAGSDKKKASGFAEVTLVLDNYDRTIDVDFNEISITRRMYRSGESEYYINKTQCRLKDIVEMLMDTGIGKEGYSIIGQGRIDDILNNKSDGRRIIFEEAAGITKYKHRKAESEKKLEHTENNIERLEDIINEINNQLTPLGHQAEMAKKYLKLSEELKAIEVNLIINNIEKSKEKLNDIVDKLGELNKLQAEKESEIEKHNEDKEKIKVLTKELELKIQAISEEMHSLINQKEKLDGEGRLLQEKESYVNATMDKLDKEESNLKMQKEQLDSDIDNDNKLLMSYENQVNALLEDIILKEQEYKSKFSSIDDLENKIEEIKDKHINLLNKSYDKKNSINSLITIKTNSESRINQLNIDNALLSGQYEEKISMLEKTNLELEGIQKNIREIIDEKEELTSKRESVMKLLEELQEQLVEERSKKDNVISRLRLLEEMERDYGGYNKTVKTILMKYQNEKNNLPGFRGAVGEVISVDAEYAIAIEVALGSSVQNIITNNEEDAKIIIEFLKKNRLGRATFLPISSIKGKTLNSSERKYLDMPGVIGIAADMVRYEKEYKDIIYHLLGRILVVDNMDTAVKLAKSTNYSYRIVTLEGELISPGGAITGGSLGSIGSNIITRKSQIAELKGDYSSILKGLDRLGKDIEIQKDELDVLENHIGHCTDSLHNLEIEINNKKNRLIILNNDLDIIKSKILLNNKELQELSAQRDEAIGKIDDLEKELVQIKDEVTDIEKVILTMQDDLKVKKEQSIDFYNHITTLKVEMAETKQKIISIKQNIERNKQSLQEIESRIKNIIEEKEQCKNELIEIERKKAENKKNIEDITEKQVEKQNELEALEESRDRKSKVLEELEEKIKSLQLDLGNIQNNLHKTDMAKVKIELDIENLEYKLLDTYELSYRKALELRIDDFNISKASKQCEELKEEIRALGTINVNAVEEYEKLNQRYEFLQKQLDDLIKAKESLIKVIDDITKYMKKQFIEEFNKINTNFNEVFVKLFGGGKAQVVLADEEDVLNSDIDIIAKPPSKKLQSLSLLSGGERALTAIALLFAILKMKPAPFCILDEIDSALDDANVDRYAMFLKEFSTQFIIITHRKGSMVAADCLYGVTMDETGTSKLLSVKLEDKVS
ncbi:chromosome segregation protein SMC [Lutispora thermophila]|uniref:Chromosome partition protein Smc n=1 Tax=Lutispora thermophila DSM 19022 TaxID=1122184 RepID=A0A1M6G4X4_9FIRM|nr:chromosome segregation protein SMC [Lutispora thermophila]SHJ05056.1 condensin subunit Smc [Lutispora thermophila DSM 19022]